MQISSSTEAEQDILHYINRLEASTNVDIPGNGCERLLRQFRLTAPNKFVELCKVHLSFLLDIPNDFLVPADSASSQSNGNIHESRCPRTICKSLYAYFKRSKVRKQTRTVNPEAVSSLISCLISRKDEFSEGLFRKNGNLVKQKFLVKQLNESPTGSSTLYLHNYSIHDLACALKTLVLRCPIIPENIAYLLLEVTKLDLQLASTNPVSISYRLIKAKQLKGYRILCLLLQSPYRQILLDLLHLLHLVSETSATRMTPESLGTLFGPPLLLASGETSVSLWNKYVVYGRTIRNLIDWSEEVGKAPAALVLDIKKNAIRARERIQSEATLTMRSPSASSFLRLNRCRTPSKFRTEEDDALDTCVRFAATTPTQDTPGELDKLMIVINGMPNKSAQKKKYVRRFARLASSPQPYPEKSTAMSHINLPTTPRLAKSGQSFRTLVTPKHGLKSWNSLVATLGPVRKSGYRLRQNDHVTSCIFSKSAVLECPYTPL